VNPDQRLGTRHATSGFRFGVAQGTTTKVREDAEVNRPVVPAVFHLRRARDLIDRHYAEPLDLDDMARAAGFSRYHFARGFRAAYGETPGQYLTRRRVERAQDLLRSADLTVTEICHLVGFTSLGSFSARFSELVGASPTAYRKVHAERAAPRVPDCFVMAWGRPGATTASTEKPAPVERP
jgi:AraC-like DNA-binding protein